MEEARLCQLRPQGPLSEFVESIWTHEGYGGTHTRERVLPSTTVDLIFSCHPLHGSASSVAGPRSTCLELDTSQPFSACGVHFKPGRASRFLLAPTSEFHDRIVDLDILWGPTAR